MMTPEERDALRKRTDEAFANIRTSFALIWEAEINLRIARTAGERAIIALHNILDEADKP